MNLLWHKYNSTITLNFNSNLLLWLHIWFIITFLWLSQNCRFTVSLFAVGPKCGSHIPFSFMLLRSLLIWSTPPLIFQFPPLSYCGHWVWPFLHSDVTEWFYVVTCFYVSYKWKSTLLIRFRTIASKNNPDIVSLIKSTTDIYSRMMEISCETKARKIEKSEGYSSLRNSEIPFFFLSMHKLIT